ncbi:hypothetical protein AG1IA_10067 [Rhizoctonia solani AG-1 IA]|uniref:Uncharacterized protein n=1 Tax=Thanatephorus cucumeris (strain AG1-IA) TaxID=983506 RepID=L8WGJ6_THACA|nr:hypothetical protein AG1IA_10067 [Rhizoctonia solani AG-1 IA]
MVFTPSHSPTITEGVPLDRLSISISSLGHRMMMCNGKNITIDDSDPAWSYTSSGQQWGTSSTYVVDYYQQTEHVTNVAGATASVQFEGNAVYLYGGTLDDHGTFNVQVNDHPVVSMNGSTVGYHSRVLLVRFSSFD